MTNRTHTRIRRPLAAVAVTLLLLLPSSGCTTPTQQEVTAGVNRFVDQFGRGFLYGLATNILLQ